MQLKTRGNRMFIQQPSRTIIDGIYLGIYMFHCLPSNRLFRILKGFIGTEIFLMLFRLFTASQENSLLPIHWSQKVFRQCNSLMYPSSNSCISTQMFVIRILCQCRCQQNSAANNCEWFGGIQPYETVAYILRY